MSAWRPTWREPRRPASPIARAGLTVDIAMTCSSVKPMPRKRAMISTMLCTVLARPGMVRSVLMQCGVKPWSRTRRPTLKPKFIRPCAVSSHTPRAASSLASGTSLPLVSSTPPGLAVNRCVTMSPGSSSGKSSRITFGSYRLVVSPMCTMSGTPLSRAARLASRGISIPKISSAGETMRALIPLIRPRCSRATRKVLSRSMLLSAMMSGFVARPVWQMCRSGITSVSHLGRMWRGNALKVAQPELPASTTVVTPACTPAMSGCTPLAATPSKTCVCRSMRPGVTVLPGMSMTRRASDFGMFAATRAIFPSSTATSSTPRRSCPGSMTLPPFKSKSYMVGLLRRSEPDRDAPDHVVGVEVGLEVQPALVPQLEVRKEGVAVLGEQREVAEELEGDAAADEPAQDERRLVRVDGDGPRRTEADVGLEPALGHLVARHQRPAQHELRREARARQMERGKVDLSRIRVRDRMVEDLSRDVDGRVDVLRRHRKREIEPVEAEPQPGRELEPVAEPQPDGEAGVQLDILEHALDRHIGVVDAINGHVSGLGPRHTAEDVDRQLGSCRRRPDAKGDEQESR